MGQPRDVPELDLAIDHVEERSAERTPIDSNVASIAPISGDTEELEFDLLGATSLRHPDPRRGETVSLGMAPLGQSPAKATLEFPPGSIREPYVKAILPPDGGVEAGEDEFHPPSLRVPERWDAVRGPEFAPTPAFAQVATPLRAEPGRGSLPPSMSVPDLAVPQRASKAQARPSPAQSQRSGVSGGVPSLASPRPASPRPGSPSAVGPSLAPSAGSNDAGLNASLSYLGGNMLGEFDFDDGFDAPSAPLGLGGPKVEIADDGPYPTGATPEAEALNIAREKVEALSGFPVPPGSLWLEALYFITIVSAKKGLVPRRALARERLERAEAARDEKLGELAESFRVRLQKEERFASLYGELSNAERGVASERGHLLAADHKLAERLEGLDHRLGEARERLAAQAQVFAQASRGAEAQDRNASRTKAHLNRLQIEMRNVARLSAERAPGESHMPAEFAARYTELENESARVSTGLTGLDRDAKTARAAEASARDAQRRLEGDVGRLLAERQNAMAAYEGGNAELFETLREAEQLELTQRAETGRALLRLRSEVPLDKTTRIQLMSFDEAVKNALVEAEALRRAEQAYDEEAFRRGRKQLLALIAVVFVALLWLIVR